VRRIFRLSESRPDPRRDVADEIDFHLDMRAREFVERGLPPDDARRAAAASFGDVAAIEAECRDVRVERTRERARRDWLQGIGLDAKVAARGLWTQRGFTAAAGFTLALGIGAAAAVFAIVDGVLLRPLPYHDPARLAMIWMSGADVRGQENQLPLSAPNYIDVRDAVRDVESIAAFRSWPFTLSDAGEPEQVSGVQVMPALFATLGVRATIGRTFTPADAMRGGPKVAVISDALWRRRYGADRSIVGRQITLSGDRFTVVGVAAPGFAFPRGAELPSGLQFPMRTDVWTPLVFGDQELNERGTLNLAAVARLRAGATFADLNAQLGTLARRLAVQYPRSNAGLGLRAVSLADQAAASVRRSLLILLGAVGFVLLIASVNVANLVVARARARQHELAIRAALGAGAQRIARQLVVENVLLALIGAVFGIALAAAGTRVLLAMVPGQLPRIDDVSVDWRVLAAATVAAVAAGVAFGLAAAIHARRAPLAAGVFGGGSRATAGVARAAGRRVLVGTQIALSLVLLVGAGLLSVSFVRLQRVDPGFVPTGAVTGQVVFPISGNFDVARDGEKWAAFFGQLTERVGRLPNVAAAGAVSALPLSGTVESAGIIIEGRAPSPPGQGPSGEYAVVSGDYFRAIGMRLIAGRVFDARDRRETAPVIVVSREFERRYFPGDRAIGHLVRGGYDWVPTTKRLIVGVVDDVRQTTLDAPPAPAFYVPQAQMPYPALTLVVRTRGTRDEAADPLAVLPALRRELRMLGPEMALARVRTLDDVFASSLARQRFSLILLAAFAASALLLALVGLYGVIALSVGQRRRELGVRIALGARPGDVISLVLREGARVAAVGVAGGLVVAAGASRVMRGMLYGVSAVDPFVYAAAAGVVVVVALAASWLPARGATRIDPVLALRAD
jgi:predicted permease